MTNKLKKEIERLETEFPHLKKVKESPIDLLDEQYLRLKAKLSQKQEDDERFEKWINEEISETPNDNDCCREYLINLKSKINGEKKQ